VRVQLIALATIVRKEVTRFLRIWTQALVPAVITTTLYFVIFGNLIGRRIGEMGGFPYIDFIVPGLILMSVITASYANVSSSFFSAKFQDFIEEILVSPTTNLVIIVGYVTGDAPHLPRRRVLFHPPAARFLAGRVPGQPDSVHD